MINIRRENSIGKKDVKPFAMIYNKNSANSLMLPQSNKSEMLLKPSKIIATTNTPNVSVKENYLDVSISPRRLSHITEKSADERLTVKSKKTLRRSSSSCCAYASKHNRVLSNRRSVTSQGLLVH
jgi:hypothetical protein